MNLEIVLQGGGPLPFATLNLAPKSCLKSFCFSSQKNPTPQKQNVGENLCEKNCTIFLQEVIFIYIKIFILFGAFSLLQKTQIDSETLTSTSKQSQSKTYQLFKLVKFCNFRPHDINNIFVFRLEQTPTTCSNNCWADNDIIGAM